MKYPNFRIKRILYRKDHKDYQYAQDRQVAIRILRTIVTNWRQEFRSPQDAMEPQDNFRICCSSGILTYPYYKITMLLKTISEVYVGGS